jgi:hypothetical protein
MLPNAAAWLVAPHPLIKASSKTFFHFSTHHHNTPPPHRRLLDNSKLAKLLEESQTDTVEFTVEQWLDCSICDLRNDDIIKSGECAARRPRQAGPRPPTWRGSAL